MDFVLALDPSLQQITETLVSRFAPRRVVLFGSRARGEARSLSDYDIMVEMEEGTDIRASRSAIYSAIKVHGRSVDVIVRTSARFAEMKDDPGYIDWDISREGRILYERDGSVPLRPGAARVSEPRDGWPSVAAWVRRSEEDYDVFESLIGSARPAWSTIGFLAHQSVEKLLKALILRRAGNPSRTHSMREILAALPDEQRTDQRLIDASTLLQGLYPRTRYPDDDEDRPLTEAEARDAAAAARLIRSVILPLLVTGR